MDGRKTEKPPSKKRKKRAERENVGKKKEHLTWKRKREREERESARKKRAGPKSRMMRNAK